MNRSTTAMVLSALVLPGAGQLYLKSVARGLVLAGVSLVCLWFIVAQTMRQASALLLKLETEGGTFSAAQVADLVSPTSDGAGVTLATLVLAVCWVIGVVDVYRLGNKQNAKNSG